MYIYIYVCVCVCVYIYIYMYNVFQMKMITFRNPISWLVLFQFTRDFKTICKKNQYSMLNFYLCSFHQ